MKISSNLRRWTAVLVLIGVVLACNFPGMGVGDESSPPATPTLQDLAVTVVVGDGETPTPEPGTAAPDVTPSPTGAAEDDCTFRAAFVEDVTIPDNTEVEPGETFVKTWRIRNSGTCPWEAGTTLVPVPGDDLGGPASVSVPATDPEEEIEISVTLQAPEAPGTYKSNWQLRTPEGTNYGGVFYALVVVPGGEAETTVTPTPDPDDEAAAPPKELLADVTASCDEATLTWIDAQGESAYRLEGPDLDVNLGADTTSYTWEDPPEGVSVVALVATDGDDEIGRVETTVSVACGKQRADLVVGAVTFDPAAPVAYLPLTVTVTISNAGDLDSGGFVARWWHVKTASGATCRWVVAEGLVAGKSLELTCTALPYNAAYAELVTVAEVDATDLMQETDEDNNTLEATTAVESPVVVYDFVENADAAAWTSGPPTAPLPWSGEPEDEEGYVRLASGDLETGGTIQGFCLEMHPRRVAEGWVRGEYTDLGPSGYTIAPGDHLRVTMAMLEEAAQGAVTYRVMLVPTADSATWVVDTPHAYGDGVEVLNVDLSSYAGQEGGLILQVEAGPSAQDDRACWLDAVIYRYP